MALHNGVMPSTNSAPKVVTRYVPEWSFADRLRKVRIDAGYDQREFAETIGITASSLAAYETGRATPRFKDINTFAERVEEITGAPAWWLLDIDIKPIGPVPVKSLPNAGQRDYLVGDSNVISLASKRATTVRPIVATPAHIAPVTRLRAHS